MLPRWKTCRVRSINQDEIEKLQRELKATPYQANRTLALLSKMFNLAVKWHYRPDNPVHGIAKFKEHPRDLYLSEQQVVRLKHLLDAYHNQNAADAIRLLLLTGAREGETLKADWGAVRFEALGVDQAEPSHEAKQSRSHAVE